MGLEWVWGFLQPGFVSPPPASQNHFNHWRRLKTELNDLTSRDVHETFLAEAETEAFKPEAETEANNKKMCIFKLFKTWKLFEMYNLTWNGIIIHADHVVQSAWILF